MVGSGWWMVGGGWWWMVGSPARQEGGRPGSDPPLVVRRQSPLVACRDKRCYSATKRVYGSTGAARLAGNSQRRELLLIRLFKQTQ